MNKNTLNALLLSCEPQILSKADKCLQRNTSISVKCFPDEQGYCFEGFIMERGNRIWMPYVVLNSHCEALDLYCQCQAKTLCVHKAILLLATKTMLETGCGDYKTATKLRIAEHLAKALNLH